MGSVVWTQTQWPQLEWLRVPLSQVGWVVGLAVLLVLVGAGLALACRSAYQRWLRARRMRRAIRAEGRARALLERHGYRLLGQQVCQGWPVRYGSELFEVNLRVDYLVEKRGRTYVADVKTGQYASNPRSQSIRRQLFEYLCAYQADGALLVDMENQRLVQLAFPALK